MSEERVFEKIVREKLLVNPGLRVPGIQLWHVDVLIPSMTDNE